MTFIAATGQLAYTAFNVYAKNVALAYAWIVVSFDAWFYGIESLKTVTAWKKLKPGLQSLLFVLYPAYFGYSSSALIASYKDTPSFPIAKRSRQHLMMILLFIFGSFMGRRSGTTARQQLG